MCRCPVPGFAESLQILNRCFLPEPDNSARNSWRCPPQQNAAPKNPAETATHLPHKLHTEYLVEGLCAWRCLRRYAIAAKVELFGGEHLGLRTPKLKTKAIGY